MVDTTDTGSDRRGVSTLLLAAVIAVSVAHGVAVLAGGASPGEVVETPLLDGPARTAAVRTTAVVVAAVGVALWLACRAARRRGVPAADVVRTAAPLALVGLAPYAVAVRPWQVAPLLLLAVASAAVVGVAAVARLPRRIAGGLRRAAPHAERWAPAALGIAVVAWIAFVAVHTVLNHWSLGTSAYDLGIQENVVWNTLHGRPFETAIMDEGSYLGVHASFVLLLAVPFYALAERSETLLILQAAVLGGAAWPLYLLARRLLAGRLAAAVVALLYLLHPGVHGAAFYDFHAVAFAPLALFLAAWALAAGRRWTAVAAVLLLLSVKEDMSILVALLGVLDVVSGRRRRGALLVAAGVAAYLLLQHGVIPHFAGGAHSYSWYYEELIPAGEGPRGLVTTVATQPLAVMRFVATPERALYLMQMLAPFGFALLLGPAGWILTSYGLAISLLASRAPLHQIGFQYALVTVAPAAVATVCVLGRLPAERRRRALAAALVLASLCSYQFGMLGHREGFRGGFRTVDFDYDETDRERYREVRRLAALIPPGDSVTASERLVPHVAQRRRLETIRLAPGKPGQRYDWFFILHGEERDQLARMPEVSRLVGYELVEHGRWCTLLRRRTGER